MPEKLTAQVMVRMDDPLLFAIRELSELQDLSTSTYIRRVMRKHVLSELAARERLVSHVASLQADQSESQF